MPRCDGTGSGSMGALSVKGAGNCTGGQGSRIKNGYGRGGAGRGQCGWFNASDLAMHSPQENEENLLRQQADALRKQQDEITRRLGELGK